MNSYVDIIDIADHPRYLENVYQWHLNEWGEEWAEGLRNAIYRRTFPRLFIALQHGIPIGTAMLVSKDMNTRPDLSPWLGGVFVIPNQRKHGIATKLIQHCMTQIEHSGIRLWWLYTMPHLTHFYARFGWQINSECIYENSPTVLMQFAIK